MNKSDINAVITAAIVVGSKENRKQTQSKWNEFSSCWN